MNSKLPSFANPANLIEHAEPVSAPIPDDLSYEQIADEVIRGKRTLTPPQMRLLIEIYPYYRPKLTAVAHFQGSFAEALEQAIERRANRPPPSLLIEAKPVEPMPASALMKPFPRRRV
jgi:hypothetical protein